MLTGSLPQAIQIKKDRLAVSTPVILLVDDEVPLVQTLTEFLNGRDYPVVAAHSGQEALEKLAGDSTIDVVILDVRMPGMDGIATMREIKRIYPLVEVIMLTGHATVDSAVECMRLGACDYLMKPVDLNVLVSKINEVQEKVVRTERLVTLGRLAATLGHEINNPLTVVLTYIKLMLKLIERQRFTAERLQEIKNYLTYMEGETSRCGEIVKNLVAFARQSRIEMKPNCIREIIDKTLLLTSYDFRHRHIQFVKELKEDLPPVRCDFKQIQQALLNILNNAAQAMTEGGTLTLQANRATNEGFVELVITDTGCGIPAEHQKDIFEPFFTTKEEGKGTGLGLAVVHNIITRHQGIIEVESPPADGERGACFRIQLPIAREAGN